MAVSLVEAAAWALALTFVFFRDTALLWIIPTPATVRAVGESLTAASNEIALGAAPLEAGPDLAFLIVGATALLAIIIDHVVLTARMPLLAAVGLIAVSLIPSIAVPRGVDVAAFVMLAGAVLFLIRAETRAREPKAERAASRSAGATATALGIGAVAVIVAIVAAPLLPQPSVQPGAGGIGTGPGIDVSLQLGDDLRRPRETVALTVRSNLRRSALSARGHALALRRRCLGSRSRALGAAGERTRPERGGSRARHPRHGIHHDRGGEGPRLALAAGAVPGRGRLRAGGRMGCRSLQPHGAQPPVHDVRAAVRGRDACAPTLSRADQGAAPRRLADRRRDAAAAGRHAADHRRDRGPRDPGCRRTTTSRWRCSSAGSAAPAPSGIRWTPRSRIDSTAAAPRRWRGSSTCAKAIASTSRLHSRSWPGRSGCRLASSSDISRAPRPPTKSTGRRVYQVSSSQLHAWPEVYFDGIGWIPFEPTVGLGTPTTFAPAATLGDNSGQGEDVEPTPSASASALDPAADQDIPDQGASGPGASSTTINPLPAFGMVIAALAALAIPALIQGARTRRLLRAARQGDAVAAWTVVQDAAIDLGIPVPASDSPRSLGHRLIHAHGAPLEATTRLVSAIERASYSPAGGAAADTSMADAAAAVRAGLLAELPSGRRALAVLIPRSLVIRPGSVYAGAGARTSTVPLTGVTAALQELRVPEPARLRGADLGLVVDVDDAEAPGVAPGPLEVVHQRPDEVALQRQALGDRPRGRPHVRAKYVRALRIVDRAVRR